MAFIIIALTVIANLVIASIAFNNNRKSATNLLLALFSLFVAGWTLFNYLPHLPAPDATKLFWVRLVMFFTTPIGAFIYLLANSFPGPKINLKRIIITFVVSLNVIISMLCFTPLVFQSLYSLPNGTFKLTPGPAIILYGLNFVCFMTLGFIILIKKYKKSNGYLKKQLQFFLFGLISTVTLATITNFLIVALTGNTRYTYLGPPSTLILVSSILYAMLRHHLLEIRQIVARAVTYSLLLLTFTIIAASSLFFAAQFLSGGLHPVILSTTLAIIFAFAFNPLKKAFEKVTVKYFYQQAYSSEVLLGNLGEITRSTLSLGNLGKHTLDELTHTMHLSQAVLIINRKEKDPQILCTGFVQKPQFSQNTLHNLTVSAKNQLLNFDDLEESPEKMLLRQERIAIVMPLKTRTATHGLLLLGEKASGEIYSQQDLDVLEILMPQLSVAIQNALSYEEIKGFADTLKEEVNKATADLKQANRNLKHLDKLKDEFVFIATHELKNPVTALRGYLSMLDEGLFGPIPPKMKDPFNQMKYSNQQLVDLVNDLLQIARAEAKTLTIATTAIDIKQLVEEICANLKPLADQKHLTITYDKPKKEALMAMADEARFKEVMNNLISNAIKYSPSGTITVSHEYNEDKVITHVQDQGYGIADKDQKNIFTRFFRVEEEAARGIPGTGLGLFIVKQIVEKMHGKIWFNSLHGKGTIFSFSLPKA